MKLLVTGACGFVGSTLVRQFRDEHPDIQITGLDNLSREGAETNRATLRRLGVPLIHADLRCPSDVASLPDADWVVDAAALPSVLAGLGGGAQSRQLVEHNLGGTLNLLEYCRERRAGFILLSTSRVYSINALCSIPLAKEGLAYAPDVSQKLPLGCSREGISEEFSTEAPLSLYGATKRASEQMAVEYGLTFGFPVWINRCGVLAGAGQFGRPDQGIFAFWINAWLRERSLKYIGFDGTGAQSRDCLHPSDLVPLLKQQMADSSIGGNRIQNLSGGRRNTVSLAELSAWCTAHFGPRTVGADPRPRPFDIAWLVLDSASSKARWGWEPRTPIDAILTEIADHAKAHPEWLQISGLT